MLASGRGNPGESFGLFLLFCPVLVCGEAALLAKLGFARGIVRDLASVPLGLALLSVGLLSFFLVRATLNWPVRFLD